MPSRLAQIPIWFQRSSGNSQKSDSGPFVPPRNVRAETEALATELVRSMKGNSPSDGGTTRLNRLLFEGRIEQLLGELADDLWRRRT